MNKHKDFITTAQNVCNNWKSDTECPIKELPPQSIVIASWPNHVNHTQFNGDCDLSGPYNSVDDAVAVAKDEYEIDERI